MANLTPSDTFLSVLPLSHAYECVLGLLVPLCYGAAVAFGEGLYALGKKEEAAEKLRDKYLCVDREHAVKLPAGAYFVKDIIGCEVFSTLGDALGRVVDVYETPSTDVYVIKGAKRLSVPALKKLLSSVDIENKRIVFDSEILAEVGLFED